jgi:gamma-glutamylputrescine oxidase
LPLGRFTIRFPRLIAQGCSDALDGARPFAITMIESCQVRDAVFWFDRKATLLPPLSGEVSADVVVVGGGMMGLMCARALAARGRQVCLVEADTCGGGASGRSSGFITPDSELELQDLVRQFGPDDAGVLWRFAWSGVNAIREAVHDDAIDCDRQRQDALFVAASPGAAKTIWSEHAARQACGEPSTVYSREELPALLGAKAYFAGLRFGDTFGLDGYRCCAGLRRGLLAAGVRIFEQSRVTEIRAQEVRTAHGAIRAPYVVVCADRFLPSLGLARREIYHAQTFLAISEPLDDPAVRRIFPQGALMVWDTDLIYHYFRLTGERRLLIGGGTLASTYARHEQHDPARAAQRANHFLARRFPGLHCPIAACWPGLIGVSKDFAPVVGRHRDHATVRFAGGAAGLPWAAALGRYLAESIIDDRRDLDGILSAGRHFVVGPRWQAVIGAPAAFALSHGLLKFSSK